MMGPKKVEDLEYGGKMIHDDRIHSIRAVAFSTHPFRPNVELWVRGYGFREGIFDIQNVEWGEGDSGKQPTESFVLSHDAAQELMNSLWECGLRPGQGAGSAGQLETMKAHLEDMRKIAFKFLKIE